MNMAKRRSKGSGSIFKRDVGGPWHLSYYDHTGKRRTCSTRTTDRRAAERILSKHVANTALMREGVIDPRQGRFSDEDRRPLAEHIQSYLDHCVRAEQAAKHIAEKRRHLTRILMGTGATRLSELTADLLERHLYDLRESGLSARTVNFARQSAVAFLNWLVRSGRVESNPLAIVAKLDESRDRRLVRRPLTDDELGRLLDTVPACRKAWYLGAALAGLRRGDLQRLSWGDVDFHAGTITIRYGKARRVDTLSMHRQLASELKRLHAEHPALPTARVFPTSVTALTVQKDFLRAGLARREAVTDDDGEIVMIGKGSRRRPKTRIVTTDEEGRTIDLHALRTTLATNLVRRGTPSQITQRIMRHADIRTTQRHYIVLGLADTAAHLDALPDIGEADGGKATRRA